MIFKNDIKTTIWAYKLKSPSISSLEYRGNKRMPIVWNNTAGIAFEAKNWKSFSFRTWFSELINGGCNFFGSEQPSVLDSQIRKEQTGFHYQTAIGRAIDKLYFAPHFEPENDGVNLIFQGIPSVGSKKDEHPGSWLDLDVIDTTTLDTNVNNLRHAAFSVNTVLLRDIEEIIVTGRRAAKRTSLLHKEGNVFEYCQAPSFVVPK